MTPTRDMEQRMQLSFILNDDEVAHHEDDEDDDETDDRQSQSPPASSRQQPQEQRQRDDGSVPLPRAERARYLQNLRQRRYRARKKSTLTALQRESQALFESNARLESDVLTQLHDALLLRERQRPSMTQAESQCGE
ncbi:hypothetical protein PINS_up003295 [Pythium insidiosum]|nr:hypothetical protein PINS_up003295 [Pythium insidiosum]